jgi:hypothetical protein
MLFSRLRWVIVNEDGHCGARRRGQRSTMFGFVVAGCGVAGR